MFIQVKELVAFNNFSGYWLSWTLGCNLYTHDGRHGNHMQEQAMEEIFSWDTAGWPIVIAITFL